MGRTGVRKLMKQQENMEITVTDTTGLPWKKWHYLLPIKFVNLISDSGSGKQNQEPFLLSPQVKLPLFSEAMSDMDCSQDTGVSLFSSFSLLLFSLCVPAWAQHRFKSKSDYWHFEFSSKIVVFVDFCTFICNVYIIYRDSFYRGKADVCLNFTFQ